MVRNVERLQPEDAVGRCTDVVISTPIYNILYVDLEYEVYIVGLRYVPRPGKILEIVDEIMKNPGHLRVPYPTF
ncbi:hypothetical protein C0993_008774, partial [Termitomyces sp. T159_Od127]